MHKFIRDTAFVLTLIFGTALNVAAQKNHHTAYPDWIEHPYKTVSPNKYLLAVGSSDSETRAKKNALKNLSQFFLLKDKESEQTIREYQEFIDEKESSDRLFQLLSISLPHYENNYFNTRIIETFTDDSGTCFVLVGIPVRETSAIYSNEISNNKLVIARLGNQLSNEKNRIKQLGLVKKALLYSQINEILQKQREALTGVSSNENDEFSTDKIIRRYRQISEQCPVVLSGYDVPELIFAAIAEVLQKNGFILTANPSRAILKSEVSFSYKKAEIERQDARFVQWVLTIHLQDLQNNDSFKTFSIKGRDGGLNSGEAVLRAEYSAGTIIRKQFSNFLNKNILQIN